MPKSRLVSPYRRLSSISWVGALLVAFAFAPPAHAEPPSDVLDARAEFVRGAELVRKAQWADALAAFERSASLRPHAVTTFNMAVCERAIGHYTRARKALLAALEQSEAASPRELPESLATEAKGYLDEIERLLPRVRVKLEPGNADIAVDGRPLEPAALHDAGEPPVLFAGVRAPGRGEPPPSARFDILLDPGPHLVTLSRKGFADALVNKTVAPGSTSDLELALDRLPATLRIAADRSAAIVTIDGKDVGAAPVDISRPGGRYQIVVQKDGFVPYSTQVVVRPGEELRLNARLPPSTPALTQRWWFWTGAAALVAGAVVATYVASRPEPQRPPLDGGGLGWTIDLR